MSEKTKLDDVTIKKLRAIRRANAGVLACSQLLAEHSVNKECSAVYPGVVIRFEPEQEMGLQFAIEACATVIAHEMDEYFDELEVDWQDEICAKATAEGEAAAEMQRGDITYAEYEKRLDELRPH